jgi:ATP adenylyltransferase
MFRASDMTVYLESGTLWPKIVDCTELAIADGSLHSIETLSYELYQEGKAFTVRVAKNLKRKNVQKKSQPDFNPFLPPETSLTVADLTPTHIAVLNKFNVVNHHLLIITRSFESQESLLTQQDFEALCLCLPEYPSLAFYNGGEVAGASQKHKHLQMVPLPLYGGAQPFPFAPLFTEKDCNKGIQQLSDLPFLQAWCPLPSALFNNLKEAATYCYQRYRELLSYVHIGTLTTLADEKQSAPYNLLMTEQWMLLVPRSKEHWLDLSVNAMGYAGSLFVMDHEAPKDYVSLDHLIC